MDNKFNIRDSVWFMHNNKPINLIVEKIEINAGDIRCDTKDSVFYSFISDRRYEYQDDLWIKNIPEEYVFKTKEELIGSL